MSAAQPDPGHTAIFSAFDLLLDEIDATIADVHQRGARSFAQGDYAAIRAAAAQAEAIAAYRARVVTLRQEWPSLAPAPQPTPDGTGDGKRLPRGRRTPEHAFYLPILRALVKLGGSAPKPAVLDEVGRIMHPILRDVDREPLHEGEDEPRWRNTSGWARMELVRDGLMKSNSPRGTWEISPAGRAYLEQNGG